MRRLSAEDREFERLYGPSDPVPLADLADFLTGFDAPWWVAGGWAIEAFTGVRRDHHDVDVSILHRDLPLLRAAFAGRAHLWSAGSGALRPLDDDWPDLHPDASQLWIREHALAPWRADVLVNPDDDGRWVNRRWPEHVAPLEDITWTAADGLAYLNPEIALLFKAKLRRPKDQADLEAALPLLTPAQRSWLHDALVAVHPGHPWIAKVAAGTGPHMSDEKAITVERSIDASTKAIFELISDPTRHAEIDGSGFVISDDRSDPITGTGQVFRMNMTGEHMGGDYQTDNTVTGYDTNHLLAWQTAPADTDPPGWEWVWELEADGSDQTLVSLTYDWSKVTDPEVLKQVSFPLVDEAALESSLDNLAAAVKA